MLPPNLPDQRSRSSNQRVESPGINVGLRLIEGLQAIKPDNSQPTYKIGDRAG